MQITPHQLINPAIYQLDDRRRKANADFRKKLEKADFLSDDQKRRWKILSYYLKTEQLEEASKLIDKHDLKRMRIVHELEKLKTKHQDA